MADIHTVFGAGQVGTPLAAILASQGHAVRLVRRSAPGPAIPGVTWLQGDVTDREFADGACRGAAAVYNCTNPPDYGRWDGVLQPLFEGVLGAATRAGARLVHLDNLYMYGRPTHVPFSEQEPMHPCSDKGEMRKQLVEALFEAHARGDVQVTTGRASDYFGPDTPNAAAMRAGVYDAIVAGRPVYLTCNPDMPHSYSYTPDVAAGLAMLGQHDGALGRAWHLPVASQGTTRALLAKLAAHAGTPLRIRRVPRWALAAVGVVSPLMSSLAEMTYQWETPYVVDDGDFRRTFGLEPTPLDEAVATTLHGRLAPKAA